MRQPIFCDFEFTCGHSPVEIIQIGAVKLSKEETLTFNSYVKPKFNPVITPFCHNLTGIMQEDIDNASSFRDVLKSFKKWIGEVENSELVFWGENDAEQLKKEMSRYNLVAENLSCFNYQEEVKREIHARLGLTRALALFEVPIEGIEHDALSDALNLKNLYFKIKESPEKVSSLELDFIFSNLITQLRTFTEAQSVIPMHLLKDLLSRYELMLQNNSQYTIEERNQILHLVRNELSMTSKGFEPKIIDLLSRDIKEGLNEENIRTFAKKYRVFKKEHGEYSLQFKQVRRMYYEATNKFYEQMKSTGKKIHF